MVAQSITVSPSAVSFFSQKSRSCTGPGRLGHSQRLHDSGQFNYFQFCGTFGPVVPPADDHVAFGRGVLVYQKVAAFEFELNRYALPAAGLDFPQRLAIGESSTRPQHGKAQPVRHHAKEKDDSSLVDGSIRQPRQQQRRTIKRALADLAALPGPLSQRRRWRRGLTQPGQGSGMVQMRGDHSQHLGPLRADGKSPLLNLAKGARDVSPTRPASLASLKIAKIVPAAVPALAACGQLAQLASDRGPVQQQRVRADGVFWSARVYAGLPVGVPKRPEMF